MHTIFITGGTGCIGSVTIHKLLQSKEVVKIIIAARSNNTDTLKLWLGKNLDPRLEFVTLDVADYKALEQIVTKVNPTHIVHLGAFQSPDCSMHHIRGMEINTGGTMALFDIAETLPKAPKICVCQFGRRVWNEGHVSGGEHQGKCTLGAPEPLWYLEARRGALGAFVPRQHQSSHGVLEDQHHLWQGQGQRQDLGPDQCPQGHCHGRGHEQRDTF